MNKEEQIRRVTDEILIRIKSSYETHKKNIERLNAGGSSMGMGTNAATQKFYQPIDEIIGELKNLLKSVSKSEKLRKERRTMYERKIESFIKTLEQIRNKRHSIKIKINDELIQEAKQTRAVIEEASANLRNFDKEAGMFCGKSHDFKPAVERSMTDLAEHAFLWASLPHLQSLTNDSVKEIYKAVEYQENDFKHIQNEIRTLWPDPKVEVVQKEVRIPEIQVIKEEHNLIEAHELLFGFTQSQNVTKALEIYFTESKKDKPHPTAFCALGQLYEEGRYLPKDLSKAVSYFKKSADVKNPEGQYKMGQYLEKGLINSKEYFSGMYPNRESEIRAAIQYYEKAAKQGHLDAMTDLGYIYERGVPSENANSYFVEPHPEHALKYYQKASKMNFPRAYNNLGTLYLTSQSLPEDTNGGNTMKGINALEKAIQLKYPRAFLNLGKCYENGVGVPQSLDRARTLYLKGAEVNDIQCKLQYVKTCLGSKIDDDKVLFKMVELTRQVLAEDGRHPEALYYMGLFAEQGIGMDKNKESSFFYIETSARLEYAPAITKLGNFYYSGFHVPKDIEYARKLYERAAKKDPKALISLGVMAEKGFGEENDPKKAQQLYEEAASMGNPEAMVFLGLMADTERQIVDALKIANNNGSREAAKLLHSTNAFVPKKQHEVKSYVDTMKTLQNFYVKGSMGKKQNS